LTGLGAPLFSLKEPWPLDHVGIVVPDLSAAAAPYEAAFGVTISHRERLDLHQVEVAFLDLPHGSLELITPLTSDSSVARFLAKKGPGLHHICFQVESVGKELERFQSINVKCLDFSPRPGARGHLVGFLHPSAFGGVLVELAERSRPLE
jgi:methylmalonyl-CoA/ethylmalonyl-CoA epimerase